MKKRILAALVASAAVLSMAGCNGNNASDSNTPASNNGGDSNTPASNNGGDNSTPDSNGGEDSTPTFEYTAPATDLTDEDNKLSIGIWTGNGDYNNLINYFKEVTGTTVEIVPVSGGAEGGDARDGYKTLMEDNSVDLDLIICDTDWVRNYVSTDEFCADLSTLGINKADYKDAYSYTLGVGTGDDGVLRGVSFQATPGCWFYNTRLAKEHLGVETPEQMQEMVKDWDTFNETAKKLKEATSGSVALTCTEGGVWQVYQCKRSQPWVVDGKLVMDNAEDFFDIAKNLYDNGGLTDLAQWDPMWGTSMQDDAAIGEFASSWGLTGLTGSILGDIAGEARRDGDAEYAAVAGPAEWYWGGSYFCVTNKCNTKKTAFEFINFYTLNADTMAGYTAKTGDFMNNKTVMNNASYKNPSLVGGQDHLKVIAPTAEKIDMDGKLTTYDSRIKELLNDHVKDYMTGKIATKDEAIQQFKDAVKAEFTAITVE
ncbi:MAG: ABC transporter substrate-binding protein [Oscillospiraceae bacterium]|nr:ABC transporter substrate-binding protein [Oscillospiraceae bacterium]